MLSGQAHCSGFRYYALKLFGDCFDLQGEKWKEFYALQALIAQGKPPILPKRIQAPPAAQHDAAVAEAAEQAKQGAIDDAAQPTAAILLLFSLRSLLGWRTGRMPRLNLHRLFRTQGFSRTAASTASASTKRAASTASSSTAVETPTSA